MFKRWEVATLLPISEANFKKSSTCCLLMTKCDICNEKLPELFLEKIKGTIVYKPGSKKQYYACSLCQKKFPGKEEMLKNIK